MLCAHRIKIQTTLRHILPRNRLIFSCPTRKEKEKSQILIRIFRGRPLGSHAQMGLSGLGMRGRWKMHALDQVMHTENKRLKHSDVNVV